MANLAAVDATSGAVTAWDPNVDPDGYVQALALSGSTAYVGGGFFSVGGKLRFNLAAVDAATGLVARSSNQGGASFSSAAPAPA